MWQHHPAITEHYRPAGTAGNGVNWSDWRYWRYRSDWSNRRVAAVRLDQPARLERLALLALAAVRLEQQAQLGPLALLAQLDQQAAPAALVEQGERAVLAARALP